MKRIKDRPMTPLLIKQMALQEQRMKDAGNNAKECYSRCNKEGTIYSDRFKLSENVFRR